VLFFHFFLDGKVGQKIKTNVCSATFVVVRCWALVLLKSVLFVLYSTSFRKTRISIFENEALITIETCTIKFPKLNFQ